MWLCVWLLDVQWAHLMPRTFSGWSVNHQVKQCMYMLVLTLQTCLCFQSQTPEAWDGCSLVREQRSYEPTCQHSSVFFCVCPAPPVAQRRNPHNCSLGGMQADKQETWHSSPALTGVRGSMSSVCVGVCVSVLCGQSNECILNCISSVCAWCPLMSSTLFCLTLVCVKTMKNLEPTQLVSVSSSSWWR